MVIIDRFHCIDSAMYYCVGRRKSHNQPYTSFSCTYLDKEERRKSLKKETARRKHNEGMGKRIDYMNHPSAFNMVTCFTALGPNMV